MSRNIKKQEIFQRNNKGFAKKNIPLNDQEEASPTTPNDNQFLSLEIHILRVHVNCDGCRQKVKKILKRIEGVYSVHIDAEEQKVTVRGNVDSASLIRRLLKSGKHAELWSPTADPDPNEDSDQPNYNMRHHMTQLMFPNFHGVEEDAVYWLQRNKNQLNGEQDWSNEIDSGEFEEDIELHEYATPQIRTHGFYDDKHPSLRDFPAYVYQYYPTSYSMIPDLSSCESYDSNGRWMRNESDINNMMLDGHMQIHSTWPAQNANWFRGFGYGDHLMSKHWGG